MSTIATLLPNGEQQFIDGNGVPYAGGSVYFYIPNTSTPKNTYQNVGETILNTNPVILDAAGRAIIYGSGQYRQVLVDSLGNTVWDQLTQDIYGLVMSSNNDFTGTNTFEGDVNFNGHVFFLNGAIPIIQAAGTVNVITATYSNFPAALTNYLMVAFVSIGPNTVAAPTFSPDGLTAHPITARGGLPLIPGDIGPAGYVALLEYNLANTRWELLNPVGNSTSINGTASGRLTLTSGVPVPTTDSGPATTIYFTPYHGNNLPLYTGSAWTTDTFSEIVIPLGTLASGKNYDLFAYDNAGVVTFDSPAAWSTDTARTTGITFQNGVYVKSGDATRRYIGSFRTTSTTTTEDSNQNRFLYNAINPAPRALIHVETTASWTYTTNTLRQANASASNQINLIDGIGTSIVNLELSAVCSNASQCEAHVTIGLSALSTGAGYAISGSGTINNTGLELLGASFNGPPGVGYHFLSWLEQSVATGTTTWYGNGAPGGGQLQASGLSGYVIM